MGARVPPGFRVESLIPVVLSAAREIFPLVVPGGVPSGVDLDYMPITTWS
jgi:hypothetical protein